MPRDDVVVLERMGSKVRVRVRATRLAFDQEIMDVNQPIIVFRFVFSRCRRRCFVREDDASRVVLRELFRLYFQSPQVASSFEVQIGRFLHAMGIRQVHESIFAVQYGSEREDAGRAPLVPFLRGCDFPEDVQVREEEAFFLVEPPPVGIIALVVVRHIVFVFDEDMR